MLKEVEQLLGHSCKQMYIPHLFLTETTNPSFFFVDISAGTYKLKLQNHKIENCEEWEGVYRTNPLTN